MGFCQTSQCLPEEDHVVPNGDSSTSQYFFQTNFEEMVMKFDKSRARDCAEVVAKEAWDRWIREESGVVVDDITAMAIFI